MTAHWQIRKSISCRVHPLPIQAPPSPPSTPSPHNNFNTRIEDNLSDESSLNRNTTTRITIHPNNPCSRSNSKALAFRCVLLEMTTRESKVQKAHRHHWRGWKHYQKREFALALMHWRQAFFLRLEWLGLSHASSRESQDLIGCCILQHYRHEGHDVQVQAQKRYCKSLVHTLACEKRGDDWTKSGDYEIALQEYQKSLDLEEEMIGRNHPVVATLYRKMAITLQGMGQLEQSTLVHCDELFSAASTTNE